MIVEDQSEVLQFLSRVESYETRAKAPVVRLDTHISAVFKVGCRVFKLKRAVKFSYLDFSTADLRHAACLEEVRSNSRAAPDLYIGVLPVTREADGRLALAGRGDPVDWLVEMVRFDEAQQFDRLAQQGALKRRRMEDLAAVIARFHAESASTPDFGGHDGLAFIIDSNSACFAEAPPTMFDAAAVRDLEARSWAALREQRTRLERRRQQGRVRHCHGDLHLRNICMMGEGDACLGGSPGSLRPILFDGIEFNPALANIDVLYDLAFLLMDLEHQGLKRQAGILFNRYMDITGDTAELAVLPLFMSVRAAIRAHVGGAALATLEDAAQRDALIADSRRYLDSARAYLEPPSPRLVAVGGLSGSGKSRLARELAPELDRGPGALVVRTDVLRKRLCGVSLFERLPPEAYSPEMTERTYQALWEEVAQALAGGRSVVADAVFSKPRERQRAEQLAAAAGVPFAGLWLSAAPEIMAARIVKRTHNASDATPEVLNRQLTYDLGEMTWSEIDSGGPREATLSAGRARLGL
ncbi:bifunctional aminoglycoside phosphotransferase/ATP-binding protein [Magnetospira thiophila]